MSTKLSMVKYGKIVGTREEGRDAQKEIIQAIERMGEGDNLVISLDGMKVFSGSFADEAIVTPYQRLVGGEYGEKYMILDCDNRDVLGDMEAKLERRKLSMLAVDGGSGWYVIGGLKGHLKETLDEVIKNKEATANDLAKKLRISLTNSNNRLSTLHKMGLIKRERINNPSGGIFYTYKSLI